MSIQGRPFSLVMEGVSVSATQDLLEITCPSTCGLVLLSFTVTQDTDEVSQQLPLAIFRNSAAGSGGSTLTPGVLDPGDTVTATCKRNVTTPGTRSPAVALWRQSMNLLNGWLYVPVPEERIQVPPSGIIAINLVTAPSGALPFSVTANLMEL
jgi:hypothetical protein